MLDQPETVRGRRVVDFASGSGLVGIAAAKAGASSVVCADIDPFCRTAIALNAELNDVALTFTEDDLIGRTIGADVLLAGDVFYDSAFAARLIDWFDTLRADGIDILIGDPGRSYLPRDRLTAVAEYAVPVTRALEDAEVKRTTVWRFG